MNQMVLIALRRPYTFVVLAILIVLFGAKSVLQTPTDVFPNIKIPVISVVWSYAGLLPSDVSGRITLFFERALTSTVEGIKHIQSHSYYGFSITNIFLQDGIDVAGAEAEVAAISQTVVKQLPPDISPPMIMRLEASSVPVAMLQITSDTLTPADLYNLSITQIRPLLVEIPGAILPQIHTGVSPCSCWCRSISRNCSPVTSPRVISTKPFGIRASCCPAGDQKIEATDWMVQTNASPMQVEDFNNIPIKRKGNSFIYVRDVADVQLAGPPQTNAVLVDGKQAIMIVVMKSGEASTLAVVDAVKRRSRALKKWCPRACRSKS